MKITHYICPRGCGKTTKAKELQMEDPENTLLFTLGKMGESYRLLSLRGSRYKRIIFDEFLLVCSRKEKKEDLVKFYDWILCEVIPVLEQDGELILISTSDKLYDPLIFSLMASQINLQGLLTEKLTGMYIGQKHIDFIKEKFDEMKFKFLDPSIVRIVLTHFNDEEDLQMASYFKQTFGEDSETYKTHFLGQFLNY